MDQDLLSEEQSQIFSDMIRDIVKQVKNNPKQTPVVTIPHKYRQVSHNTCFTKITAYILERVQ